jgi:hypothetical protein
MRTTTKTLASLVALSLAACASNQAAAPATVDAGTTADAEVPVSVDAGTTTTTDAGGGAAVDGGTSSPATDGGSGATSDAAAPSGGAAQVGLSSQNFAPGSLTDKKAIYDLMVGTHPVAIYTAHASKVSAIGLGSLTVVRENAIARMTLKNAAGAAITTVQNNFDTPSGGAVTLMNYNRAYKGDVSIQAGTEYLEARFGNGDTLPRGMIKGRTGIEAGWVPNGAEQVYYFRNNVTHAGAPVPQAFAHLAGTYKGPFYSPTGAVPTNEVTVTIKADGEVTVSGTNAYNAQLGTLTLKWDGNDDFIAPNLRPDNQGGVENAPGEFQIVINANNGYGSLPLGGITLTVPALDSLAATPRLLSARAALSTNGALEVRNPTRN